MILMWGLYPGIGKVMGAIDGNPPQDRLDSG